MGHAGREGSPARVAGMAPGSVGRWVRTGGCFTGVWWVDYNEWVGTGWAAIYVVTTSQPHSKLSQNFVFFPPSIPKHASLCFVLRLGFVLFEHTLPRFANLLLKTSFYTCFT